MWIFSISAKLCAKIQFCLKCSQSNFHFRGKKTRKTTLQLHFANSHGHPIRPRQKIDSQRNLSVPATKILLFPGILPRLEKFRAAQSQPQWMFHQIAQSPGPARQGSLLDRGPQSGVHVRGRRLLPPEATRLSKTAQFEGRVCGPIWTARINTTPTQFFSRMQQFRNFGIFDSKWAKSVSNAVHALWCSHGCALSTTWLW